MLALYTTPLSANGRKVLAVSRQLGLEPRVHPVDVYRGEGRSPEYLAINPSGKIPTLVDAELTLTESNAILLYLADAYRGGDLLGRDPADRARVASWMFWEAAHWQPALTGVLAPAVGHRLRPDALPEPEAPPDWSAGALAPLLERLETALGERAFLTGDAPTLADFSVGGMTTYFRACGFPSAAHPRIAAWLDRLDALDAWRETRVPPWA